MDSFKCEICTAVFGFKWNTFGGGIRSKTAPPAAGHRHGQVHHSLKIPSCRQAAGHRHGLEGCVTAHETLQSWTRHIRYRITPGNPVVARSQIFSQPRTGSFGVTAEQFDGWQRRRYVRVCHAVLGNIMGWLKRTLTDINEATGASPIRCPRGWGDVSFVMHAEGFPPFFSFSRKCPIAGVDKCHSCRYPFNPQAIEELRGELVQLQSLVDEGLMSDSEYLARRRLSIGFQHSGGRTPGSISATVAWILGPLGIVVTVGGWWLSQNVHLGFGALGGVGAVLLALAASFAGIAYHRRQEYEMLFHANDLM